MEENENKMSLSLCGRGNLPGAFASYVLSTANPDDDDFKSFYALATEIMEYLFVDCVILCEYPFVIKNRWLLPDRPATFLPNQDVDEIVDYISKNNLDWQYCYINYTDKSGWFKYARKSFFVSTSKINQLFINQNYIEDVVGFLKLIGYNSKYFAHTDNVEKMANDLIVKSKFSPSYNAISVSMYDTHTMMYIDLNPIQYPLVQLIERIRTVCEKDNKILEVNI